MRVNRREEIIIATLELTAAYGLGSISMNMIAEKVGIRKPSLYNHFSSKDEIVEALYQFLRDKARENGHTLLFDYEVQMEGKTALEVLQLATEKYLKLGEDEYMQMFHRVIYSERCMQPVAAKIMAAETEKMILTCKALFYAMQVHELLYFENADMSAVSFALTIHGLIDWEADQLLGGKSETTVSSDRVFLNKYLEWFCKENKWTDGKDKL